MNVPATLDLPVPAATPTRITTRPILLVVDRTTSRILNDSAEAFKLATLARGSRIPDSWQQAACEALAIGAPVVVTLPIDSGRDGHLRLTADRGGSHVLIELTLLPDSRLAVQLEQLFDALAEAEIGGAVTDDESADPPSVPRTPVIVASYYELRDQGAITPLVFWGMIVGLIAARGIKAVLPSIRTSDLDGLVDRGFISPEFQADLLAERIERSG